MNNEPLPPRKVYFAHRLGTFDVDAVTGLVPATIRRITEFGQTDYCLKVIVGTTSTVLTFETEDSRDIFRTSLESEMGICHDIPGVVEWPSSIDLVKEAASRGLTPGGPEDADLDPGYKHQHGVCVMANCRESAGDGSIVCKSHADQLNATGRVES
jgi:hypothetical protein